MNLYDYIAIFIILDLAGFIHILFIKKNYLKFLNFAICKKLFWKNKTWRWLIIMSLFSCLIGSLYFNFIFSFLLWFIWILWELPNSFIKRKLWIKPGSYKKWIWVLIQYIFDTLDSVIAIIIFLNLKFDINIFSNFLLLIFGFLNHSTIDYLSHKFKIKKLKSPNPLYIFTQLITRFVFQIYFLFYKKNKKIKLKNLEINEKYIFIANHISKLDPFLICSNIKLKNIFKLIPFRFMVSKEYMDKYWIFAEILWCYSAHFIDKNWNKKHNLDIAQQFLERGETLFIFPEWWIKKQKFWVGAFYLNKKVDKSKLLLFVIKKQNNNLQIDFLWKKDINKLRKKDLLESSKIIFKNIKDVYKKDNK